MSVRLPAHCDRVLLDELAIRRRVKELGRQISDEFRGEDLRLITVLKGGLFFLADLCRAIDIPLAIDFLAVTPYAPGQGGVVRVTKDLSDDIDGSAVVLGEDVVDPDHRGHGIGQALARHAVLEALDGGPAGSSPTGDGGER